MAISCKFWQSNHIHIHTQTHTYIWPASIALSSFLISVFVLPQFNSILLVLCFVFVSVLMKMCNKHDCFISLNFTVARSEKPNNYHSFHIINSLTCSLLHTHTRAHTFVLKKPIYVLNSCGRSGHRTFIYNVLNCDPWITEFE